MNDIRAAFGLFNRRPKFFPTGFSMKISILFAVCICSLLSIVKAEDIKCPDTADVWISTGKGETDTSGSKTPRLKLKFYQEFGLFDFDVSKLG